MVATVSGCLLIPQILTTSMPSHREVTSDESTERRSRLAVSGRCLSTRKESFDSTGTHRFMSARHKKARYISERSSYFVLVTRVRLGNAFLPISPQMIRKNRSRSSREE